MSEKCKHRKVYFRDLLTGQPLERRCLECNELLGLVPTTRDLERQLKEAQGKLEAIEAGLRLFDAHLAKPHDHECGICIVRNIHRILKGE